MAVPRLLAPHALPRASPRAGCAPRASTGRGALGTQRHERSCRKPAASGTHKLDALQSRAEARFSLSTFLFLFKSSWPGFQSQVLTREQISAAQAVWESHTTLGRAFVKEELGFSNPRSPKTIQRPQATRGPVPSNEGATTRVITYLVGNGTSWGGKKKKKIFSSLENLQRCSCSSTGQRSGRSHLQTWASRFSQEAPASDSLKAAAFLWAHSTRHLESWGNSLGGSKAL